MIDSHLVSGFLSYVEARGNKTKQFLSPPSLQLLSCVQTVGCLQYLDLDKLLWVLSTVESHKVGSKGAEVMLVVGMTFMVSPS